MRLRDTFHRSAFAAASAIWVSVWTPNAGIRLIRTWIAPPWVACEGEVTYLRHDGSAVTVPFADVFELRGTLISIYRIYIDNSPLFSQGTGK